MTTRHGAGVRAVRGVCGGCDKGVSVTGGGHRCVNPLGTRDDDSWADDVSRRSKSGRVGNPRGVVDIDADSVGLP